MTSKYNIGSRRNRMETFHRELKYIKRKKGSSSEIEFMESVENNGCGW